MNLAKDKLALIIATLGLLWIPNVRAEIEWCGDPSCQVPIAGSPFVGKFVQIENTVTSDTDTSLGQAIASAQEECQTAVDHAKALCLGSVIGGTMQCLANGCSVEVKPLVSPDCHVANCWFYKNGKKQLWVIVYGPDGEWDIDDDESDTVWYDTQVGQDGFQCSAVVEDKAVSVEGECAPPNSQSNRDAKIIDVDKFTSGAMGSSKNHSIEIY